MMANSPILHAEATISFVRQRTSEVVLFYSGGGKDSLVLLDMLVKRFDKVHCVFMFFVPDLDHQKPYLNYVRRFPNCVLHQYPHWNLSHFIRNGEGLIGGYDIPKMKLKDIEEHIRNKTGCEWIVYGWKMADTMTRRLVLKTYLFESICVATKKVFPLSHWKKNDVLLYITQQRLLRPITYAQMTNTSGLDLLPEPLIWVRDNWPTDYKKICAQFPRAEAIVLAYEHSQKIRQR